jgi:hypothetical protein
MFFQKSGPFLLSLRPPLKALQIEPFLAKNWWKTAEPRVHREGTDPLLNPICRIQPDTAVYSCLVLNLVVLVLFFFSYHIARPGFCEQHF